MNFEIFNETVIDHFHNPRNVGGMDNPDGKGCYGDYECGDYLKIFIKVKDDIITDISFLIHGCVAAIASSSMTTVLAKGKSIREAMLIKDQDILNALGGLTEDKVHCSLLGEGALKNAIEDYMNRR